MIKNYSHLTLTQPTFWGNWAPATRNWWFVNKKLGVPVSGTGAWKLAHKIDLLPIFEGAFATMPHLAIHLLGHFEVMLDNQPALRFRTDKMCALLAYLTVEAERSHRREMLAGLLWPEFLEADARHNLSQTLWRLRELLGTGDPPYFLATRQTLRFNPASDATVDVAAFQTGVAVVARCSPEQLSADDARTLTQAVALYRGEFLSTPLQVNSQAFEEWQLFTQMHLHLLALEALDTLGQYHAAQGEFAQVATYARRQIELDPLREAAHRQLMMALARAGRLPEALAQYADCTALLARELGIAPAPETTALYEQLRAGGHVDEDRTQRPGSRPGTGPLVAPPPTFVGRAPELTALDEALARTLAGQGQVRFVTGDAGSGKTALLTTFARRALAAHTELLVLNGAGNAYTGLGDPYWPFLEMLRQLSAEVPGSPFLVQPQAARLATCRPATRAALTAGAPGLLHWLTAVATFSASPAPPPPNLTNFLTRALTAVAEAHPLVLIVDDMQWADQESRNLLLHLGRRLVGQRILILGAARADALDQSLPAADAAPQPLMTLYNELRRYLGAIQLDLAQAEGRPFINALLDSEPNRLGEAFRETLYRRTGGHALFTTELLSGMQVRGDLVRDARGFWVASERLAWDALPARVEGVIAERIGQLLPDWQTLLTVASVEGDEFTAAVVADVLGLSEAEVCRRCSGALARQHNLLVPLGVQPVGETGLARYRFRHLLFQQYCYAQLDAVEQARLHLRVGHMLETLYGARAPEIALALARHFELGGETATAVAYLLQAGQRATRLAATEEALHLLTHGLTLLKQLAKSPARDQQETKLHLALGSALLAQGWDTDERAQTSARAYALGQHAGDLGQVARSLVMMADAAIGRGQLPQLAAIGEQLQALAQHPHVVASAPLAAQLTLYVDYVWGSRYFFRGDLPEARRHLTCVSNTPDTPPDTLVETNLRVIGQTFLIYVLWLLGYPDQALACSQRVLATTRDLEYALLLQFALSIGAVGVRYLRREPRAMQAALHQLAARDAASHAVILQPWVMLFTGWLRAVDQHDAEGLDLMHQAVQSLEEANSQRGILLQYNLLMDGYLALGQADAALAHLDPMLDIMNATELRNAEAEFRRLKGEALRALDQPDAAEACFQRALSVARAQSAKAWELRAALSLCRLYQATGQATQLAAARAQLAEVYGWFTEGFATGDLQEAAALLAETGADAV